MGKQSWTIVALLSAALVPQPADAQGAEATVYRDAGYSGPAIAVQRANPDMRIPFSVQSIRIGNGAWQLCPQTNFRGNCITIRQSNANLARSYGWRGALRSIRPVDDEAAGSGPFGSSPTLKGMASQYFPKPRYGQDGTSGRRVEACPGGNGTSACAQDSADAFCKRTGWRRSAFHMMETERGAIYLADVLCVRAG